MEFTKDPSTHPANGPLTGERLIRVRDELAAAAKRSDGGNLSYMMADAAKAIEELLSLRKEGQEPVYQVRHGYQWRDLNKAQYDDHVNLGADGLRIVYAAPQLPQPAVPDENGLLPCPFCGSPAEHYPDGDMEGYSVMCGHKNGDCDSWIFGFATPEEAERSWNTRAAVLQGAEPVRQPLAFFDGDISPEDAEKIIARLREMNSRPGSQQVMIAEPASQPNTLRDGWVAVPVEPTEEMLDEFDSIIDYGAEDSKDAWSRLIAAAPQQEADNG